MSSGALFLLLSTGAIGQTLSLHGQASGWITVRPSQASMAQTGARYLPEMTLGTNLGELSAEADLALNGLLSKDFARDAHPEGEGTLKPYRAWIRLSSEMLELRLGLQKISFGSATLFRPLMWFDRLDPRDPIQIADGVYALLLRYYFLDNANIWFWALYGNNDTKGWELAPTEHNTPEFGGRVQTLLWSGEVGCSYHHRRADLGSVVQLPVSGAHSSVAEDRIGLDGKWDLGVGLWVEAVLLDRQTEIPGLKYQRQWTLGADYTFDIGGGLTALTEYFRSENPNLPFGPAGGTGFSGWSLNYPLGVIDRISLLLYRDWTNRAWYRLATWQSSYDNWVIYLIGYWNPENVQLDGLQTGSNPYAGTGIQLMVVFNH
jgi:hypothetical protein